MYLALGIILTGIGLYKNRDCIVKKNASFLWKGLYIMDECNKYIEKIKNNVINLFINNNHYIITYTNESISTINSNKNILSDVQKQMTNDWLVLLAINKDSNKSHKQINMQRIMPDSDINKENTVSNVKFYATSIRVLENNAIWAKYPIDLSFDSCGAKYNYMVTNNILFDKVFVYFWLKYYNNIVLSSKQTYEIELLDHNMENIIINEDSYIRLLKDNYNIIYNNIHNEPVEL